MPLSLSDAELAAVMNLARPIPAARPTPSCDDVSIEPRDTRKSVRVIGRVDAKMIQRLHRTRRACASENTPLISARLSGCQKTRGWGKTHARRGGKASHWVAKKTRQRWHGHPN